jgi:hypothetical protein
MQPVNMCPRSYAKDPAINTKAVNRELHHSSVYHQCKHQWNRSGDIECPRCTSEAAEDADHLAEDTGQLGQFFLDEAIERRRDEITKECTLGSDQITVLGRVLRIVNSHSLVADLGHSDRPTSLHYALTPLIPLDQCIMAIIWELLDQPGSGSILSLFDGQLETSEIALPNFAILLRSAALYQAKLESVSFPIVLLTRIRKELIWIGFASTYCSVAHLSSRIT